MRRLSAFGGLTFVVVVGLGSAALIWAQVGNVPIRRPTRIGTAAEAAPALQPQVLGAETVGVPPAPGFSDVNLEPTARNVQPEAVPLGEPAADFPLVSGGAAPTLVVPASHETGEPGSNLDGTPSFAADPAAIPPYSPLLGLRSASLTVDWVTPETIVLGQEADFELVLRNRGRTAVEQVVVEQALPEGFRLVRANPAPQAGEQPSWQIPRLDPQQEARIVLRLVPGKVGLAESQARVHFSTASTATFRVVEPKLKLEAEVPEQAIVGNQAIFTVTVRNPGSGRATNTVVSALLPKALVAVGQSPRYELGTLNPGESRSVRVLAQVTDQGRHECRFVATADNGLQDEATKSFTAIGARLEIVIDGPRLRFVTRPADYEVHVKNTGTAAAHNVHLQTHVPKAFAFLEGGLNGRFDGQSKTINWFVGQLDIGQEFVGHFRLRAQERGSFPILAHAEAERGHRAEAQHVTQVDGIAAILLEVVDVDDPIEVGAQTMYEILVTNQGTEFAQNVQIVAKLPDGMEIIGSRGPSDAAIEGQTIRFAPLPKLAPRADAIYRIQVRGLKAGDQRIEVQALTDSLRSPVTELESTKVYLD